MSLLSPEQVIENRKRNSKLVTIDEMGGLKLLIVKVTGTAANRATELLAERAAGKLTQQAFMLEMFTRTLATEDGKLLDKASALQLLDECPMSRIAEMLGDINASVPKPEDLAKNSKGSPADA